METSTTTQNPDSSSGCKTYPSGLPEHYMVVCPLADRELMETELNQRIANCTCFPPGGKEVVRQTLLHFTPMFYATQIIHSFIGELFPSFSPFPDPMPYLSMLTQELEDTTYQDSVDSFSRMVTSRLNWLNQFFNKTLTEEQQAQFREGTPHRQTALDRVTSRTKYSAEEAVTLYNRIVAKNVIDLSEEGTATSNRKRQRDDARPSDDTDSQPPQKRQCTSGPSSTTATATTTTTTTTTARPVQSTVPFTAELWNAPTDSVVWHGKQIWPHPRPNPKPVGECKAIALADNSLVALSASGVRLISCVSGEEICSYIPPELDKANAYTCVAAMGSLVFAGGRSEVTVLQMANSKLDFVAKLDVGQERVNCLATGFINGTAYLAIGLWNGRVAYRPIAGAAAITYLNGGSKNPITALHVSNHIIAAGSSGKAVWVWKAQDLSKRPIVLRGHVKTVLALAVSPHYQGSADKADNEPNLDFASTSKDGTLRFWDLTSGLQTGIVRPITEEDDSTQTTELAGLHWDQNRLLVGGKDSIARLDPNDPTTILSDVSIQSLMGPKNESVSGMVVAGDVVFPLSEVRGKGRIAHITLAPKAPQVSTSAATVPGASSAPSTAVAGPSSDPTDVDFEALLRSALMSDEEDSE